jgi:hypothetical protein
MIPGNQPLLLHGASSKALRGRLRGTPSSPRGFEYAGTVPASARKLALFAVACALSACIVSVSGLTGGSPDGGCDGAAACNPAGRDGAAETASDSALRDGAASDAAESGTPDSAAACVPVATPSVAFPDGGLCPGDEAGSCTPTGVTAAALAWVPPVAKTDACTPEEIAGLTVDPVSARCAACASTAIGSPTFGATITVPEISYTSFGFPNTGGCVATLEPCNLPCAEILEAVSLCNAAACTPECSDDDAAAYPAFQACIGSAVNGCPCDVLVQAGTECFAEIVARGSPATACEAPPGTTGEAAFLGQVRAIAAVLCGGADGG